MMDWGKLWAELSQRLLMLWYSDTVRLKGLDAYYSNFQILYDLEYSTCEYYIIYARDALLNISKLKNSCFDQTLYWMSHMSGLKYFECYKDYLKTCYEHF